MLSGKAPFQIKGKTDSATSIMQRIKGGEFEFKGQEWDAVSQSAKKLIRGTVIVRALNRAFVRITMILGDSVTWRCCCDD